MVNILHVSFTLHQLSIDSIFNTHLINSILYKTPLYQHELSKFMYFLTYLYISFSNAILLIPLVCTTIALLLSHIFSPKGICLIFHAIHTNSFLRRTGNKSDSGHRDEYQSLLSRDNPVFVDYILFV